MLQFSYPQFCWGPWSVFWVKRFQPGPPSVAAGLRCFKWFEVFCWSRNWTLCLSWLAAFFFPEQHFLIFLFIERIFSGVTSLTICPSQLSFVQLKLGLLYHFRFPAASKISSSSMRHSFVSLWLHHQVQIDPPMQMVCLITIESSREVSVVSVFNVWQAAVTFRDTQTAIRHWAKCSLIILSEMKLEQGVDSSLRIWVIALEKLSLNETHRGVIRMKAIARS